MNSEVEIAIKEYYDINEKIKLLEKRKSELKEVLNSVFDSKKTNELKAENILIYRVNHPRISWDESIIKSILAPKGLWESVLGFDNKKVKNLITNHIISDKEIEEAKITVDTWYTYTKQLPIEQEIKSSSNKQSNEEIKGLKRIVITDLSRMKEDRVCIFGFDEKRRHIRPVIPHIGINEGYIFDNENKQIIKPFAEVEFDFIRPLPEPPHSEDWEINTAYKPKLIRNLSENESKRFLEEILDESLNAIFEESIQNHRYITTNGRRSIGTIRINEVLSLNFSIKQGGNYEYRMTFSDMNGDIYNLPITDLAFRKHCDNQRFQGKKIDQINHDLKEIFNQCDLFLRVGLSRRWKGFYWLLVSGVYSFPDYMEKENEKQFKTDSESPPNHLKSREDLYIINAQNENFDPDLFEVLRSLRKELADKEEISPFIIFYDISLKAMATYFPKDLQTLGNIEGVDETNLRKYGELFLTEIVDYCIEHKIESEVNTNYESDQTKLSISSDSIENKIKPFDIQNSCSEINKIDGTIIAQNIISCVSQVGESFGMRHIADVLCGSKSKKVIHNRHDTLTIYGTGKEYSREQWQDFIKELIQLGYLKSEGEIYPVIKQTQKSRDILSGMERIFLTKPVEEVHIFDENFDSELFKILRILRKELADAESVPPYIIFHDSSLKAMATHFPQNPLDFQKISGVGERKLMKYSKLFLEEIISYCNMHKIEPKAVNSLGSTPNTTITMQTPTSSKQERVSADIVRVGMSKRDMIGTLKKIILELQSDKETVHLDDIISKAESVGIERDAVKEVIQLLKRTGEIYEVSNERFRIAE